jgi:isoleucyl-tRNA synthetase
MLEIDRYALARASQLQAEVLAHYQVYEFHPVVAKLQVYCSEDLGAFYLDVLKDRLYTTGAKSLARRSAQTALWHITHAMLRWMAPFLSFTAEEAWKVFAGGESIFTETYWEFPPTDESLLLKWADVRQVRDLANKKLEQLRAAGVLGSSLQATATISGAGPAFDALVSLGDDLKFVLIVSAAALAQHDGAPLEIDVQPSSDPKCERCWHYRSDVGSDPAHPAICGRCVSNLFGTGEQRTVA